MKTDGGGPRVILPRVREDKWDRYPAAAASENLYGWRLGIYPRRRQKSGRGPTTPVNIWLGLQLGVGWGGGLSNDGTQEPSTIKVFQLSSSLQS